MNTLSVTRMGETNVFEIVEEIPVGYSIWNIGPQNMAENYLPLCRLDYFHQPFEGARKIDPHSLKAIHVKGAEHILIAIGAGDNTLPAMAKAIQDWQGTDDPWKLRQIERYKRAISVMQLIPGVLRLTN